MANLSKEARDDRQSKELAEILKRSDETYQEIEMFKDYEFSYCIAFEMAKRDPELLRTVRRFIKFYNNNKMRIAFIPKDIDFFKEAHGYRLHRRAQEVFTYWYAYLEQIYWLKPIDLYFIDMNETALEMAEVYVHLAFDIQEQQENERFTIEDAEGVFFESSIDMKNKHFFKEKRQINNREILNAIEEFDIDPTQFESQAKVTERFSRPKLSIPATVKRTVQIELNLALPEKELFAYIAYIKEKYDENRSLVKSPIELLGSDFEALGMREIDTEQVYKKDRRKTLAEKYADLFFIYDCYANNLSMDYSIDRLNRYWNEERNAFPEKFQIKTYKRYLKTAKDFIENRKYQSLLIGK